jgi:CRISPR-associated protein Csb2
MFAITVELLCGRYTATQFNDRARAEWPPHPARLFSAMVAAWADSDAPDPAERSALRWLEDQGAPAIRCSEGRDRQVVTHFVPVNDPTALTRSISGSYDRIAEAAGALQEAQGSGDDRAAERARAALVKAEAKAVADAARAGRPTGRETSKIAAGVLQVLPEYRGKQGRTYPTVLPDDMTVWFLWPDAEASEAQWSALDDLLGRVARIGHSSTLVSCRCVTESQPPTWVPSHDGSGRRMRVPRTGLIDHLERAYAFHRGEEPRTLPAGMTGYEQAGAPRKLLRAPHLGGDWYVLGIKGRRLPSAAQALAVARAVRGALLVHSAQPPAAILSGHRPVQGSHGPTAPLDGPHLAVLPLLNAGHSHSDGAVFAIALVLPVGCPVEDRDSVEQAVRSWCSAGLELLLPGGRRVTLEDLGVDRAVGGPAWLDAALAARRKTTTRAYWCRPARRWLTVTPIALDRFPGNLRSREPQARDRAEAEAAVSVARACVFAGLADAPEQVRVAIRLDAPLAGMPASPSGGRHSGPRQFPVYQTGRGTPRACVHAEIEFSEPVRGPVLVGAGRYLGYGLCLPSSLGEATL